MEKTLDSALMAKVYNAWIEMEKTPGLREQEVARRIFRLNVDPAYGKIVEPKEGGGIRLINLPESCNQENWGKSVRPALEAMGWTIDVRMVQPGRSTLFSGVATHQERGLKVESPYVSPETAQCVILGLFIAELEQQIANTEPR